MRHRMKGENTLELKETQSEMIGALEEVNVQEAATEAKRAELQKKADLVQDIIVQTSVMVKVRELTVSIIVWQAEK